MVLVNEKWAKHISRFKSDVSGMGAFAELELVTNIGKLLLVGTYWPFDSGMLAGLMGGLESWMASCKPPRRGDPMSYIKTHIERTMLKHLLDENNSYILMGDLNSSYHPDSHKQASCKAWADECGLTNTIADKIWLATWYSTQDIWVNMVPASSIIYCTTPDYLLC